MQHKKYKHVRLISLYIFRLICFIEFLKTCFRLYIYREKVDQVRMLEWKETVN